MKQKFVLSKSNKIYFGIVATLYIAFFLIFSDKTPYATGGLIGYLLGLSLFPLAIALIVWLLSGRQEKSVSITFNIVLSLMLVSQLAGLANKVPQSEVTKNLLEQESRYKQDVSNADTPAEVDAAYNKFSDAMIDTFNTLSEKNTGSEQQFYKIMGEFAAESQGVVQTWSKSYDAVAAPRILDLALLTSDAEFDYQKNVLKTYVEQSTVYSDFFANMVTGLKQRLSVLGESSEYVQGAVKGAETRYLEQLQETLSDNEARVNALSQQLLDKL